MSLIYKSFKDIERAQIYWMGGFVTDKQRNWCVRVYLQEKERVWYYLIPVGFLTSMFIDAEFSYGKFVPKKFITNHTITSFVINKLEFVPFYDIPKELYSDNFNPALKEELVCRYDYRGKRYYIPQMEIVRAFFAINSTTTHFLLMPSGLKELFCVVEESQDSVEIEFNRDFPKINVTQSAAEYFTSLLYEEQLNGFWFSIFHSIKHLKNGQLFIPPSLNVSIEFRGSAKGQDILVKKINKIQGIPCRFDNIIYSHPLINEKTEAEDSEVSNRKKGGGRPKKEDESEREVVDESDSSYNVNRPKRNNPGSRVYYGFNKKINAELKYAGTELKPRKNKNPDSKPSPKPKISKQYSTGLSTGFKSEKPIEIQNDIVSFSDSQDFGKLEFFAQAVELLGASCEQIRIGQFYGNTKFVMLDEYTRRNYAFVFINDVCVIEIERPDRYPVSTLVFKATKGKKVINQISSLLRSMTRNNGHWSKSILRDKLSKGYGFVKHMIGDTVEDYADRLRSAVDSLSELH